jgi:hypothetical protein
MIGKKGQALILAYGVITFLIVMTMPLLIKIMGENRMLVRQRMDREALYLAEGAVEETIDRFINAIANFLSSPDVVRYPAVGTLTVTYQPSAQFPAGASALAFIQEAEPNQRIVLDPDGTQVAVKTYVVNVTCAHPSDASITVTLNQAIALRVVYTFQHAVFYNDDLEILPGRVMNFTGRIHGNKDIYLDADNSTLTIDSEYLHSAGNIYNRTKDGRNLSGDVDIKKAGSALFPEMNGLDSPDANWLTESQTRWSGTVKTSVHGVTKLATPVVGSVAPNGYYASNANVKITNGIITQDGTALVQGVDIPNGTIVTDADFYNNRESDYVRMTNIDLKKLAGYAPGDAEGAPSFPNHLPDNGLIYATRDDAGVNEQPGIRLVNGTQVYRAGGLTVVSNDPLYIQGDYNTVDKKATAVICDALNILSNDWSDANSRLTLANRIADPTIVNTAFISGVNNTTAGHYNGGLENYPRFHENWTGKELSITGSFVELWNSQIASGLWAYGGMYYTAPNRNWRYDTDFNINNMPPFTPWAVEAQRGAWWKS